MKHCEQCTNQESKYMYHETNICTYIQVQWTEYSLQKVSTQCCGKNSGKKKSSGNSGAFTIALVTVWQSLLVGDTIPRSLSVLPGLWYFLLILSSYELNFSTQFNQRVIIKWMRNHLNNIIFTEKVWLQLFYNFKLCFLLWNVSFKIANKS